MKIYLARNNVQAGPYTLEELNIMLSSGEVRLDDLAWHSGMANWQTLGELTQGQYHYAPNAPAVPVEPVQQPTNTTPAAFGDNVDFRAQNQTNQASQTNQNAGERRVSVAELYGRKEAEPQNTHNATSQTNQTVHTQNTAWQTKSVSKSDGGIEYASVGTRFLATCINLALFIVALLPFLMAFMNLNPDPEKMNAGDFEARMAYAQTLAEQLPSQVGMMTFAMLGAFFLIQFLLIILRGQSFGKLLTGIRVVSESTGKLPTFGALVGVRTIVLLVIYWLASAMPVFVNAALILLVVNYFLAAKNPKKQGWHDRLAKTIIVKAKPEQLDKSK
ncbi:hypothetical protein B0181_10650 [Moraxella caviae]|uniref:RDD family n=1 Tax=Moraxella caviae TaxID=34060 RepID=A0A1S9ZV44_9GAMM|nr:RDD family protein [Moraxella caviae]OOR87247.1 hypothetical protein B0181_10650 [Moraxella caviae]STZ14819.1 RDD family [Moraxella caviae]VEW11288.1 RDD family [Moraxella caviae]